MPEDLHVQHQPCPECHSMRTIGFKETGSPTVIAGELLAFGGYGQSRIAFDEWGPRLPRLKDLPMLVVHGRDDDELAFSAGESLRDAAMAGGADVEWLPFEGGHGIPLVAWRALRRKLRRLIA